MTKSNKLVVKDRLKDTLAKLAWNVMSPSDLKSVNTSFVQMLRLAMPYKEAMERAVGGSFEVVGRIEKSILEHYGLAESGYLVDVGCGSGRLAKQLSDWSQLRYLGIDLVPTLLAYAKKVTNRNDWTFRAIKNIEIPEDDNQADMVCFFSVLTHLQDEQCFWYLEEAKRVLKPGGRIVASFLELSDPGHLKMFFETVDRTKRGWVGPINKFIDRSSIAIWAQELGLKIVDLRNSGDLIVGDGSLGQSVFVFEKST